MPFPPSLSVPGALRTATFPRIFSESVEVGLGDEHQTEMGGVGTIRGIAGRTDGAYGPSDPGCHLIDIESDCMHPGPCFPWISAPLARKSATRHITAEDPFASRASESHGKVVAVIKGFRLNPPHDVRGSESVDFAEVLEAVGHHLYLEK